MSAASSRRAPLKEAAAVAADAGAALDLPGATALVGDLVDAARAAFGAAACSFATVDRTAGELAYIASSGEGAAEVAGMRLPLGRGLAGYAASAGETLAVDDVSRDPRFARDVAERTGYVPRSILVAPAMRDDEVLGVLSVLDRTQPPGAAALDLAARFARAASGAVALASATRSIGSVVLRAAALAVRDERPDVATTLAALAAGDAGPDPETTSLLAAVAAVRRLGPDGRRAAETVLNEFASVAARRRARR